jgi:transposase
MISATELRQLYHGDDLTTTRIGERLGVSATTVQNWLRRYNIPAKPRKKLPEAIEGRFAGSYTPDANGCWIWNKGFAGGKKGRYGQLRFPDGSAISAHRLSYQLHKGAIPNGQFVCHRCDVPACVNPDHLFLGTAVENNADRDAKGRTKARAAALTAEQIEEVQQSAEPAKVIAERLGVHWATIYRVRKTANRRAEANIR